MRFSQTDFWQPLTQLPGLYPSVIQATPVGAIFAATDSGLFRSLDEGATWRPVSNGLPKIAYYQQSGISAISCSGENNLFVGTRQNGIYRSINQGESWENIGFADSIVIFNLAESGLAEFKLYNYLGHAILSEKEYYPQGTHRLYIKIPYLASGIYIVQMQTKNARDIMKMSVIK